MFQTGAQLWLEQDDTTQRISALVANAKAHGLDQLRIFLVWPFVEPAPDAWDFRIYDAAFAAAKDHGLTIKATLTANSGPWHIGTPSVLHTQSGLLKEEQLPAMERYIRACVSRYAGHPALAQWILWNEPMEVGNRSPASIAAWRKYLASTYRADINALNRRYRTGYSNFDEIPHAEAICHPVHKGMFWNSYRPVMDDLHFRSEWLAEQIAWIAKIVREEDKGTPTCVNPAGVLINQASIGTDMAALADTVDVLGTSYHPSWHFTFAEPQDFPALAALGVRYQSGFPQAQGIEVTEIQCGPSTACSFAPWTPDESLLGGLLAACAAAGAASVTGWTWNCRQQDFEAGDWGLLDNMDESTHRSRTWQKTSTALKKIASERGTWKPLPPEIIVLVSQTSEIQEFLDEKNNIPPLPGRRANDGKFGAALLGVELMALGYSVSLQAVEHLPTQLPADTIIVASHLVAWRRGDAEKVIAHVHAGCHLVIDATSGKRDEDARLYRPWPGALAEAFGFRARELWAATSGIALVADGQTTSAVFARSDDEWLDPAWQPDTAITFADGQPALFFRRAERGSILRLPFILGPSLLVNRGDFARLLPTIFSKLPVSQGKPARRRVPGSFSIPVEFSDGTRGSFRFENGSWATHTL